MTADHIAFESARLICRKHARSFYFASKFLPREKRNAAYAVYAFCRMMDDAIDEPQAGDTPASLEARLMNFRTLLSDIYANRLVLPGEMLRTEAQHALHAFDLTVHRYNIPSQHFLALAEGCRMDLTLSRYATAGDLETYCYHVAGVVGLIMSCIFGLTNDEAKRQAVAMGNAMQLTNILRDVKEDFAKGRIYLPQEDLARFKVTESDLFTGVVTEEFRALMQFEIARARECYQEGFAGLKYLPNDGSRLTASVMAVVYSGILDAIEAQDCDVFKRRARLGFVQKLQRLPAAWRLAKQSG